MKQIENIAMSDRPEWAQYSSIIYVSKLPGTSNYKTLTALTYGRFRTQLLGEDGSPMMPFW